MAGLYRRGVQRAAGTPMMQIQGGTGAGGAVPRGFAPQQQQEQQGIDPMQLGGLMAMFGQPAQDKSGFGLGSGVPAISQAPANDVLGGLALNNNGMSYEALPPQWTDTLANGWDSLKGGIQQGWQGLLGMFGGGA